ncbi:hypothetical protein COLO4_23744 [Corchorus olitorius]|uniref:F-box domain-containing protein n=1 Tax=Corchorus olitorius TaxID=93759 RepID=A0A1R3IEW1_9ROSI|nr:hypothetical protein COLO4_23744 [Corchorus olitorius]
MAATKKSNGIIYLPADLVNEILLKLAVKSIIRFGCVAKNWYHLFKNPIFVSQHRLSKKNGAASLIIKYYGGDGTKIGLMMFGDDKTFVSYHDLHQQLPCHVSDNINYFNLTVGDGLVCAYDASMGSEDMALWNPATKEFRILPYFEQSNRLTEDILGVKHYVGCGIDPLSNDYKVLCIRKEYPSFNYNQPYEYAIYRMSSDSWTVLNKEDLQLVEDPVLIRNYSNVCVNGVCYWQVEEEDPSGNSLCKLLKFHLGTEVFQLMDSPIPGSTYGFEKLMPLLDGRIALWDSDYTNHACAVWVLNLNDEGNCWTKLINIDLPDGIGGMYGFWTHGALFAAKCNKVLLYDLETGKFNDLGIRYYSSYTYYEESLLSVGSNKDTMS